MNECKEVADEASSFECLICQSDFVFGDYVELLVVSDKMSFELEYREISTLNLQLFMILKLDLKTSIRPSENLTIMNKPIIHPTEQSFIIGTASGIQSHHIQTHPTSIPHLLLVLRKNIKQRKNPSRRR